MTMRIRDNATKILRRFHMFVLKDIAKTHTVTVQVKDKATKALTTVSNFMKRRMPRTHALFVSVKDKASPILRKISQFTQRNIAKTQLMSILATDRAMPTLRRIGSFAKTTFSRGYNFSVRATDLASRVIGRVSSYATTAIPRVRTFTIRAINAASSVIGSVKRALFSIPTLITVTLAAVGMGKLKDATVGAAMDFEGYEIETKHHLGGDEKKANELVEWMRNYTNLTPFDSPDLFPALSRGIGIAGGDVEQAKDYLRLATDMAAITPGRTVSDAMDAIGNAKMGEFSMLSGFNVDMSKAKFDSLGGMEGLYDYLYKGGDDFIGFVGAAEEFSKTSRGLLNKSTGYVTASFREFGDGILEGMKPRLEAISTWIDNNQDKWMKWRDTVQQAGEQAGEWAFSKLENGFFHIRDNYLENDDFKKLDFEGKIKFISEDISAWWSSTGKPALNGWWESSGKPWAEKIGLFVGESIFNGILTGIKEGGKALGNMWLDAFKDPSLGAFGGAGVATMLAGMLASLVLSPLVTAVKLLGKGVKGAGKVSKKVSGWFGKDRQPKQPKKPKPDYRMPWTNKGDKPVLNTPNQEGKGFKLPKGLSKGLGGLGKFAKRVPVIGTALGALSILTASKEDKAGAIGAVGGGVGGAVTGAAIGSIVPGIGTAIGGLIGGVLGSIGGGALGDWFSDNWDSIKGKATEVTSWIGEKFTGTVNTISETLFSGEWWGRKWDDVKTWGSEKLSDTAEWWNGIKETANETLFSGDWWAEKVGFVFGVLETTLFSGEWWRDKWDSVKEWTSEKWESFSDVWSEALEPLKETIFSSEWWGTQWESVKSWTSEKWASFAEVWEASKEHLSTTLFSGEWWSEKWEGVKNWTSEKWNSFAEIWTNAKETLSETLFSGEWWQGKWESVKGWTSEKWDTFTSVWNTAKEKINETLFNEEWWSGKWESVKGWATSAWEGIKTMASGLGESFNRGRESGRNTASYAQGTSYHPGGLAIVGDGGGPELIRYPNGNMTLSPGTDTMMNLPRGTEVLSHRKTVNFLGNQVPAYAGGIGFNGGAEEEILSDEHVAAATSSSTRRKRSFVGGVRDVIVQITGESHYHDDMDAEKVGKVAVKAVTEELKKQRFEGGEMAIDD